MKFSWVAGTLRGDSNAREVVINDGDNKNRVSRGCELGCSTEGVEKFGFVPTDVVTCCRNSKGDASRL